MVSHRVARRRRATLGSRHFYVYGCTGSGARLFGLASNVRPRFLAFGPGKDEMMTVLFDGSVSILDLRSGSMRSGYARDKQVMSFAFSSQQAERPLAAAVLRGSIVISNPKTIDQPI